VLVTQPPYALAPTNFRFAALAALAGRAPIGGQREVALAAYVAARLVHDVVVDRGLTPTTRIERAAHAKHWLSTLALPAALRPAFVSSVDASAGERADAAQAVRQVIAATTSFLDSAAREELAQLVAALESPEVQPVGK
jgi:hypothetical protein